MKDVYPVRAQVIGFINAMVDNDCVIFTRTPGAVIGDDNEGLTVICEDGRTLAEVLNAVTYHYRNIIFDTEFTMGAHCVTFQVLKDERKIEFREAEKCVDGPTEIKGTYEVIFRRFGGEPIKRYRVYSPSKSWAVFHALKMMHQDGIKEFPDGYIIEFVSEKRIL